MTARQSDLRGPLAIVVGSEGQGLGPAVRRRADLFMRIPMKGAVGSLNAAVAGSILLFEALAQREPNATPTVLPQLGDALGESTEAADAAAAAVEPASPTKKAASRKRRAEATTELAATDDASPDATAEDLVETPEAVDTEAVVMPTRPRTRKAKTQDPGVTESAPASDADPPSTPATGPKRRARKGLSTEPADASPEEETADSPAAKPPTDPTKASSEAALLPADGAKTRRRPEPRSGLSRW